MGRLRRAFFLHGILTCCNAGGKIKCVRSYDDEELAHVRVIRVDENAAVYALCPDFAVASRTSFFSALLTRCQDFWSAPLCTTTTTRLSTTASCRPSPTSTQSSREGERTSITSRCSSLRNQHFLTALHVCYDVRVLHRRNVHHVMRGGEGGAPAEIGRQMAAQSNLPVVVANSLVKNKWSNARRIMSYDPEYS